MIITVDIGNTDIVCGVFKDNELLYHWRFSSSTKSSTDEYMMKYFSLFKIYELDYKKKIQGSIIGSVVPELIRKHHKALYNLLGMPPIIVNSQLHWNIHLSFDHPEEVGVDRLLNVLAAKELYGLPALVVDYGTATTIDIISEDAEYLGGIIAPGILISRDALSTRTAQLPSISLEIPPAVIGKNTVASMRSGILHGSAGQTQHLLEKIRREFPTSQEPYLILTGGFANLMNQLLPFKAIVDPYLTLKGLNILYLQNRQYSSGEGKSGISPERSKTE